MTVSSTITALVIYCEVRQQTNVRNLLKCGEVMSESTATRMLKHLPCDSKQHACLSVCDHSYKCQSGQRNLTKSPHHSHTWTVQWHSPGGANIHPHPTPAFLGPTESILQTASRLIQPFLHSSWQKATILYNRQPLSS